MFPIAIAVAEDPRTSDFCARPPLIIFSLTIDFCTERKGSLLLRLADRAAVGRQVQFHIAGKSSFLQSCLSAHQRTLADRWPRASRRAHSISTQEATTSVPSAQRICAPLPMRGEGTLQLSGAVVCFEFAPWTNRVDCCHPPETGRWKSFRVVAFDGCKLIRRC